MNIRLHGWTLHQSLDRSAFRGDILPSGSLRRDRGARHGADDKHPEVAEVVRAAVLDVRDEGRAEGARRVERAAVDGNQHRVADVDGEADGDGREGRVGLVLLVDGRLDVQVGGFARRGCGCQAALCVDCSQEDQ